MKHAYSGSLDEDDELTLAMVACDQNVSKDIRTCSNITVAIRKLSL